MIATEPLDGALSALGGAAGVLRVGLTGDHIRTITEKGQTRDDLVKVLKDRGIDIDSVIPGEPTLEDVFLSLTA